MKFIITGLGNPGRKYERTRHNAGFMAVDELARQASIGIDQERHQALIGRGSLEGHDVLVAKPQTFMNESGRAVSALLRDGYLGSENLIVVHDELDLPLGAVRVKIGGGHGGHNGIRSIMDQIGTGEFMRVRIGIGRPGPGMDAAQYVLSMFTADERAAAAEALGRGAEAVRVILAHGITKAMNQFNQK